MRPLPFLALLLLSVFGAGCSLFGSPDTLIVATGRVVLAETGTPVAGLGVSLDRGGSTRRSIAATARTDADGRFRLEYDPSEDGRDPHELTINAEPYDSRYTTARASYVRGDRRDLGDIEVRLNPAP